MDPERIEAQLARILASPPFRQAPRLSRFLRFVVETSRSGGEESLKEYRIGVEVFDRGEGFDPRVDPIVRVQAAKLRAKLLEYYAAEGATDPVVIGVPKGGYAPDIRARAPSGEPPVLRTIPARSRIAVLPFVNMSADPENEYFSDGLTEELINRLASVPSLQVVARTSTFRFKGQGADVREVGAKLDAGTVLEGSVRRSGDQLRVSAQLIDVQTGYRVFSRTYQRRMKDVFELQDELAQAVVDEISPSAADGAIGRGTTARTGNLEAYHAYLRGMFTLANRLTELGRSVAEFREAIALEPEFAPAWAGLSHAYWLLAWYRQMPSDQAMPLCRDAAVRTLAIDPGSAMGNGSLGIVECGFEWRWASGEARFRRALELQPGLALVYPFYAVVGLLAQRKIDEACDVVRHGLVLDPFNPLAQAISVFVYTSAGRIEDAERQQALAAQLSPAYPPIVATLGAIREIQGRMDEAIATYRKAIEMAGPIPPIVAHLGHALAATGERAEAEALIRQLEAHPVPSPLEIARIRLGLREIDAALDLLEAAVERRIIHLLAVPTDFRFDVVRGHPRFEAIMARMGIP